MRRRAFVKVAVASGLVFGTAGLVWLRSGEVHGALSVDAALGRLDALSGGSVSSVGDWAAGAIFAHCAQSVEFSMDGFPQHKPALFQNTAGQLAFRIFAARGEMVHSLTEPIPGAPALEAEMDASKALNRLRSALVAFRDYTGELRPHFAYGHLSKSEYTLAHVLHLNNHMLEIRR